MTSTTAAPFGRLMTAMITPMTSDAAVDYDGAAKLAAYLVNDMRNEGLVVNGTTGEAPTTTDEEKARLVMVEIPSSPSVLLQGMADARLPIAVAHGEGRARFEDHSSAPHVTDNNLVALRYVDNHGKIAETYPANPNGSPLGITGLTTPDGRVTIMMPHPERVFLQRQYSWIDPAWKHEEGPWMELFYNARRFC